MRYRDEKKNWSLKIILGILVIFLAYIVFADFTPEVQHVEKTIPHETAQS